ncbi:MAG: arylsulfatase A-like enzyme [Candidatus Pelagisphaera sp.]|jgi:arylsulfatase A-like enzyme
MANLVDIISTILDLQGIEIPDSVEGQRLPSATDAESREYTFYEYDCGGPVFTFDDLD